MRANTGNANATGEENAQSSHLGSGYQNYPDPGGYPSNTKRKDNNMTTRTLYLIALALLAISITINIINGFTTSSTILTVLAVAVLGYATFKKVWRK